MLKTQYDSTHLNHLLHLHLLVLGLLVSVWENQCQQHLGHPVLDFGTNLKCVCDFLLVRHITTLYLLPHNTAVLNNPAEQCRV